MRSQACCDQPARACCRKAVPPGSRERGEHADYKGTHIICSRTHCFCLTAGLCRCDQTAPSPRVSGSSVTSVCCPLLSMRFGWNNSRGGNLFVQPVLHLPQQRSSAAQVTGHDMSYASTQVHWQTSPHES